MSTLTTVAYVLIVLAHLVVILFVLLLERRQPAATLAWLLTLVFLPVVGILLYMLFGVPTGMRRSRKLAQVTLRLQEVFERHRLAEKLCVERNPALSEGRTVAMFKLSANIASMPASVGNRTAILINGAATYRALLAAFKVARHHIHVQFYIVQPDRWGQVLRDHLAVRARAGVEVRVLVDGVGSFSLPRGFWDPLLAAGGKVAVFKPVRLFARFRRRDRIDFRNHRKIVVIDGRTGFTGGINIGSEYLGMKPELGHWRDTHMQIDGPAALSLQATFAEDWYVTTLELLDAEGYYPEPTHAGPGGDVVQIVDSGPDRRWSPIQQFYFQAVALAQSRVWITSPYFIPDEAMLQALVGAALRGVDVRILLPSKSDVTLISMASRSYYDTLLNAGVRVFEYARGFVHAKTLVVDEWMGTIGSANLDMRSFYLNYEVNAFVYSRGFANSLASTFLEDLRDAQEVTLAAERGRSLPARMLQALARLLSPLL